MSKIDDEMRRTIGRIALMGVVFAAHHTLLASRPAKDLASRVFGPRRRNGLYRFAYIVESWLVFLGMAWWLNRLPDRPLYKVPAPFSWLMRLGQVAAMGWGFATVRVVGIPDFNGVPQLLALLAGRDPVPEPEAQGPSLREDGKMKAEGPFRFSRHPNNFAPLVVLVLDPTMTVVRATYTLLAGIYLVLGSVHEEHRLRAAYGEAYEQYRSGVPFYIPRP